MVEHTNQTKQTIRQLRQARGWTQEQLARRVGVTQSGVSTWERGRGTPWPKLQQRLADLFGVSVAAIAFEPGKQPPQERP